MKNFIIEKTEWRLVDYHWQNVYRDFQANKTEHYYSLYDGCLADYLWLVGFDIPETITYCIAENSDTHLKFRKFGGKITIYLHPLR